ncbi:sulfotransferase [uncultured Pseudokineococcus sp.]|uniref:sulfotransferase n=1 Tax=uncultured Pseudokineococcus sp. TaxID=1642928 RepID=UPI0026283A11|nr:sulfotransferase [uncultured Pseudokineococcus sp.]
MTGTTTPGGDQVLFIAGLGRSGSTLVERLVGDLPGACPLGEVVHLWERALRDDETCGCGTRFSACPFWTAVGEHAFGGWHHVDVDEVLALKAKVDRTRHMPLMLWPVLSRRRAADVRRYADLYERVYAAAREVSGAEVVVDSSKHVSLVLVLRRTLTGLHVLHVVRDVLGVAHSWQKAVLRPEVRDGDALMPRYRPGYVAVAWSLYNSVLLLLPRTGTDVLLLRYEDFTDDPRGALRRVAAHAGLPAAGADELFVSDHEVVLSPSHTVAGNPMRFKTGRTPLRRDESWRAGLRRRDALLVTVGTAPIRRLLGYGRLARSTRRSRWTSST